MANTANIVNAPIPTASGTERFNFGNVMKGESVRVLSVASSDGVCLVVGPTFSVELNGLVGVLVTTTGFWGAGEAIIVLPGPFSLIVSLTVLFVVCLTVSVTVTLTPGCPGAVTVRVGPGRTTVLTGPGTRRIIVRAGPGTVCLGGLIVTVGGRTVTTFVTVTGGGLRVTVGTGTGSASEVLDDGVKNTNRAVSNEITIVTNTNFTFKPHHLSENYTTHVPPLHYPRCVCRPGKAE